MNILIINFSSHNSGNCSSIAEFIAENSPEKTNIKSFAAMDVNPCGGCKYECFKNRLNCPYIEDDIFNLYEEICSSDLVYFIVPNYSDYPCSNFFLFNERGQCYFTGMSELYKKYDSIRKRFIVVSNTNKDNFIKAFESHSKESPEILFFSSRNFGMSSISQKLIESLEVRKEIINFLGIKKNL